VKIVVLGGTGLIGTRLKLRLRADWHDVVVASPATGVDAVTGAGLAAALAGAEVVYDVSGPRTRDARVAREFFETTSRRVLAAEAALGTWHHVVLSAIGADAASADGLLRAKAAQERVVRESRRPCTVVRAAPCFESAAALADAAAVAGRVLLPAVPVRPVAADDVADLLATLAPAGPDDRVLSVTGPEELPLPAFVARALRALGDERPVRAGDPGAGPVAAAAPAGRVVRGTTTLDAWCAGVRRR
jgi:uncharacterized protein YbjT (DUF2867 family)